MKHKRNIIIGLIIVVILVVALLSVMVLRGFIILGCNQDPYCHRDPVIDNDLLDLQPSYDVPFTLDRNLDVQIGKMSPAFMGIFNKVDGPVTYVINVLSCKNEIGVEITDDSLSLVFPEEVTVPQDDAIAIRGSILVRAVDDTFVQGGVGSYICEVTVTPDDTPGAEEYSSSVFITAIAGDS